MLKRDGGGSGNEGLKMVKIPTYDKNDWDQIHEYVRNLKSDRPDGSTEAIFTIPLSMALLKSAEEAEKLNTLLLQRTNALLCSAETAEKLNKTLLLLTAILTLLTAVLILKDVWP
jgi:hypothetical protein